VVVGTQNCGKSTLCNLLGAEGLGSAGGNTRDVHIVSKSPTFHIIDCPASNDNSAVIIGLTNLVAYTADAAVVLLSATNPNDVASGNVFKGLEISKNENGLAILVLLNQCDDLYHKLRGDLMNEEFTKCFKASSEEKEKKPIDYTAAARISLAKRLDDLVDEMTRKWPVLDNAVLIASCLNPTNPLWPMVKGPPAAPSKPIATFCSLDFPDSYSNPILKAIPPTADYRVAREICAPRGAIAAVANTLSSIDNALTARQAAGSVSPRIASQAVNGLDFVNDDVVIRKCEFKTGPLSNERLK